MKEDNVLLLNAKIMKFWQERVHVKLAQPIKELTQLEEPVYRAHVVTQNTMMKRASVLTAQIALDQLHQGLNVSLMSAVQPKFFLVTEDAKHAQDIRDQTLQQALNVVKSANLLNVMMTKLYLLMEHVRLAQNGPNQCLEEESVDQMYVELEKNCWSMEAANSAQIIPEEQVNKKSSNTHNVYQTAVNWTKYLPRKELASSVDHTRKLIQTKGIVKFQHVEIGQESFFKMLLSKSAQITVEQLKTANNVVQIDVL